MSKARFKSNLGYFVAGLVIFAIITSVFYEIKRYTETATDLGDDPVCQYISTQ